MFLFSPRDRSNNPPMFCTICKILGHNINNCWINNPALLRPTKLPKTIGKAGNLQDLYKRGKQGKVGKQLISKIGPSATNGSAATPIPCNFGMISSNSYTLGCWPQKEADKNLYLL